MIAMTEVEAGNVHTGIHELFELGDLPAGRTDGANDLGAAIEEGGGLLDGLKLDEAAGQGGHFGCVADHFYFALGVVGKLLFFWRPMR